jgi:hypothetical protein
MFLSKVGITNSYQEDNLALCAPFFVIIVTHLFFTGDARNTIRIHQEKLVILRVYLQEERDDDRLYARTAHQSHQCNT